MVCVSPSVRLTVHGGHGEERGRSQREQRTQTQTMHRGGARREGGETLGRERQRHQSPTNSGRRVAGAGGVCQCWHRLSGCRQRPSTRRSTRRRLVARRRVCLSPVAGPNMSVGLSVQSPVAASRAGEREELLQPPLSHTHPRGVTRDADGRTPAQGDAWWAGPLSVCGALDGCRLRHPKRLTMARARQKTDHHAEEHTTGPVRGQIEYGG